jgi:hypothetical protein
MPEVPQGVIEQSLHKQYEPEAAIHRAVNITSRALKDRCEVVEHDEHDLYVGRDPVTGVKTDFWRQEPEEAISDVAHEVEMDTCYLNECLTFLGEDSDRMYCEEHNPDEYIECAKEGCEYPTSHTETDHCSTHTWRNGRSANTRNDRSEGADADG